jgi:hypothetical protein
MNQTYTFDANIVSDLHKDAYGFRPRSDFWSEWNGVGNEGKQQIWDELIDALESANIEEDAAHKRAIAATEVRIQMLMETVVGSTREDALRFLDDAHGCNGDRSYLEFCLGVPYGYLGGKIHEFLDKAWTV